MFDDRHYVPILRAKQGEFRALAASSGAVRDALTPLVEAAPIAWDPDDDDAPAADPSLAGLGRKLERAWGTDRPLFLDLGLVPSAPEIAGGEHPLELVARDAHERGLRIIPVTSPRRDIPFQDAVGEASQMHGVGICIRLDQDDFADLDGAVEDTNDLLNDVGVGHGDADLLLDFGEVDPGQTGSMTLAAVAVMHGISTISDWRTVTWGATAFPRVADYAADSVNTSARADWAIWQALRNRSPVRLPAFGDYAVSGVQTSYDMAAAYYRPSPNLRYTTADDYLVLKARHPRHGHEQFNDLCRVMVDRPDFAGRDFSPGDTYIANCAADEDGPGAAATWMQAGVSHHLAHVTRQLANLPEA